MAMCLHTQSSGASAGGHSSEVCSLAGTVCCLGVWNGTFLPVIFSKWWRLGVSVYTFYERNASKLAYSWRNVLSVEELLQVHEVRWTLLWWIEVMFQGTCNSVFVSSPCTSTRRLSTFFFVNMWLFEPVVTNRPDRVCGLFTFIFVISYPKFKEKICEMELYLVKK